jgi:lipid-A-disaccharide synthase-like uncharacterized protein
MVFAAPFVAFFGWAMLIPEFAIVALQWEMVKRNSNSIIQAWLFSVLGTCIVFTCIGPKEDGNFMLWIIGYALGSLIAFSTSFAIICRHHANEVNPSQNQNVG